MMFSHLFHYHASPRPHFAPGLFVGLIVVCLVLGQSKPIVGLAGLGVVLIVAAVLVEVNRATIWEGYVKEYKKNKRMHGVWNQPLKIYYTINVALLWPTVLLLGCLALTAAYVLA